MTAPAGYIRARSTGERNIDRVWAELQQAREPLSAATLADRAQTSRSQVKHLLQAARDAGWLAQVSYDMIPTGPGGAARIPLYALTDTAPKDAPILSRDGSGWLATIGGSSGAALADLRKARGWTVQQTADAIGVREGRTVRRYEASASLPPVIAQRVAELTAVPLS